MSAISNDYQSCQLLNLGYGLHGRGPFAIRQAGTVAGGTILDEQCFYLRKDGTWVLNLTFFTLSEDDRAQFIYETAAEAVERLESLSGGPVIDTSLPADKSVEEIKRAAQAGMSGLWGRIRSARVHPMD